MRTSRSNRVVRALTAMASFAYFGMWAGGVFVLLALPVARVFGTGNDFYYSLELPVSAPDLKTTVQTAWGSAPLEVQDVRGKLQLPLSTMPWPLLLVLWSYAAVGGALMILVLQNLRRIFQRVRDEAQFDVQNVLRLRTLGVLLLSIAGLNAVAEVAASMVVRRGLSTGSSLSVPMGLHVDGTLVLVALVAVALAEVFRRGAELEHEQSLVV